MRGIVPFNAYYNETTGWEYRSIDRTGQASPYYAPRWDSATGLNIYAYCSMDALRRDEPNWNGFTDWINLRLKDDGSGYVITRAWSRALALVSIPPDAPVTTINWEIFQASRATVANMAKLDNRIVTRPLGELIGTDKLRISVEGSSAGYDPSLPILNLDSFDTPPMARLAQQYGFKLKGLDFIETTAQPTTKVSRAPGWLKRYGMKPLDTTRKQELMEYVPEVLNHVKEPEMLEWLMNELRTSTWILDWTAREGKRNLSGITNKMYLRQHMNEIESRDVRKRIADWLDSLEMPARSLA